MKLKQKSIQLAILASASLFLFAGTANAEQIECPPGWQPIPDPEMPDKSFCIDPIGLINGQSFTSPHSGASVQLSPDANAASQSALEDFEAMRQN